jgi:hypothetical protein
MFTPKTRHNPPFCPPSFPAEYRGLRQTSRPKRALNVAKKLELRAQELELCPAESNLGARKIETMEPRINADERG